MIESKSIFFTFIVLILLGAGCQSEPERTPYVIPEELSIYTNNAGFSFTYPSNYTIWEELDTANQRCEPVSDDSIVINISSHDCVELLNSEDLPTLRYEVLDVEMGLRVNAISSRPDGELLSESKNEEVDDYFIPTYGGMPIANYLKYPFDNTVSSQLTGLPLSNQMIHTSQNLRDKNLVPILRSTTYPHITEQKTAYSWDETAPYQLVQHVIGEHARITDVIWSDDKSEAAVAYSSLDLIEPIGVFSIYKNKDGFASSGYQYKIKGDLQKQYVILGDWEERGFAFQARIRVNLDETQNEALTLPYMTK